MSNVVNNFSIYPYGYGNELAEKRALRENEERHRLELADKLSVDMGVIAMAAITGIAGPEYKEVASVQPTAEQARKLGQAPVRHLVTIDRSPLFSSIDIEQPAAVNEHAVLGYASQRAA